MVKPPPPRLEEPDCSRQVVGHPRPDVVVPATAKPGRRDPELPEPGHAGLQQPRADTPALVGRIDEQ